MSATPIDGFKRNLEEMLPELAKECRGKVATLNDQLAEQREALGYIERVAAAAGVDVGAIEKKKPAAEESSSENGGLRRVG